MVSAPPGDDFYYTIEQAAKREAARVGLVAAVAFDQWRRAQEMKRR